ncbi:MAG: SurA N-terminal domain-containing protein [Oscillospiraceae bacterium]|nr:SurA N-terminal domain-containing protein [Oscillospiraceae bacterium]
MKYDQDQRKIYRKNEGFRDESAPAAPIAAADPPLPARRPKKRRKTALFVALGAVLAAGAALALLLPGGLLSSPLSRRDTVMTIGDYAVSSDEYVYRFIDEKEKYEALDPAYFSDAAKEAAFFEDAEHYLRSQYAVLQWAKDLGYTADAQVAAAADAAYESARAGYADDGEFAAALAQNRLTPALYRRMLENEQILRNFAEYVYSDAAFADVTDEQALAYAREKGAFAFKCILITAGEGDGAAEKEALARSVAAALQADPARFGEYAALYNEDPLADRYADGFNMLPGELSAELETAVTSLADGQVSDAILTESGWFILTKCDLAPKAFVSDVVTARVEAKIDEYIAATPVRYGRGYHNMKISEIAFAGDAPAE